MENGKAKEGEATGPFPTNDAYFRGKPVLTESDAHEGWDNNEDNEE